MISAALASLAMVLVAVRAPRRPARSFTPEGDDHPAERRWDRWHRRRRPRQVEAGYPHAVELLILAVRAGYLPVTAMELVAERVDPPIDAAFRRVVGQAGEGRRFADALATITDDLGAIAAPLVDTLAAADRYGLPLGPTLDRLAAEARDHRRRSAEARVRQLPVRLAAPMVLCTLPSFVFLAIAPLLIGAISSLRR